MGGLGFLFDVFSQCANRNSNYFNTIQHADSSSITFTRTYKACLALTVSRPSLDKTRPLYDIFSIPPNSAYEQVKNLRKTPFYFTTDIDS